MSAALVIASLLACLAGAMIPLGLERPRAVILATSLTAGLGAALALLAGVTLVVAASPPPLQLPSALPFGPLLIAPDPLSGWFLVVIGLVGTAVAVYSPDYLQAYVGRHSLRLFGATANLLQLTLVLMAVAGDAVLLLIAWEIMAWVSYVLVNYEQQDPRTTRAGYQMLVVSELGTVGLVTAFLLLAAPSGRFDFASLREGAAALTPARRDLVFLAALVGFGAKAAIVPVQLWLPDAHTAAPTNVSAVLSAVITKLGFYGIVRVVFDLLGVGPGWWGLLMFWLGVVTALLGVLYTLMQLDLKRVLAYSTIENCGLILLALGVALLFRSHGLLPLAAIATMAAMYHVLNHATYKSLLFLGAGAVDRATHTRSLARLGGLIRRMPWTAACFLVGALAIAGVPPLNGFVSEWMALEVLLRTNVLPPLTERIALAVGGPLVALTAGLVVTAFVRAFAIPFVGLPRTPEAAMAREAPRGMRLGMGGLALACVALGVLPTFVLTAIDGVTGPLIGVSVRDQVVPPLFTGHPGPYQPLVGLGGSLFHSLPVNGLVMIAAPTLSTIAAPSYLILAEMLLAGLLLGALAMVRPLGTRRIGPVWAGGIPAFGAEMQYSALAYSNPLRLIFNGIYRSRHRFEGIRSAARHLEGGVSYLQEVPDPLERELYGPIRRGALAASRYARRIQSGSVNQYVSYIFIIVLIVLLLRLL